MIHVERTPILAPGPLRGKQVATILEKAEAFFEDSESRRQERFKFKPLYTSPEVRKALDIMFNRKCAYCETPVSSVGPGEVNHFRPIFNATGSSENTPNHYWWLAYEWTNLYLACQKCSYLKGSKFPVLDTRAPLRTPAESLDTAEARHLLDPCIDEPWQHIWFHRRGRVEGITAWGATTIEVLNLNRRQLVSARRKASDSAQAIESQLGNWLEKGRPASRGRRAGFETVARQLERLLDMEQPYAAVVVPRGLWWFMRLRGQLESHYSAKKIRIRFARALEQKVAMERGPALRKMKVREGDSRFLQPADAKFPEKFRVTVRRPTRAPRRAPRLKPEEYRTAVVEKVRIRNFRGITSLTLDLRRQELDDESLDDWAGNDTADSSHAPWLMLLGENGTGKSSVLQAITLTLIGHAAREQLGVEPGTILRRGADDGFVKVELAGQDKPVELHFRKDSPEFGAEPAEPGFSVFGYGASRFLARKGARPKRDTGPVRVHNLFNPFAPLIDAADWLGKLFKRDRESFDYQALALKDLLSVQEKIQLEAAESDGGGAQVRVRGKALDLEQLSDGYQTMVALATDIMKGLHKRWKGHRMEAAEGLVLIDEVGAHLHPRWKKEIVQRFRSAFPRLQVIATTHEPLCLRGLKDGEVVLMSRGPRGRIYATFDLPSVKGMRIDQILSSEHFGLDSTVDPDLEGWIHDYYALLRKSTRTSAETTEMGKLEQNINARQQLGETERERLLLQVIDEYLAKTRKLSAAKAKQRAKDDMAKKIDDMWSK